MQAGSKKNKTHSRNTRYTLHEFDEQRGKYITFCLIMKDIICSPVCFAGAINSVVIWAIGGRPVNPIN